MPEDSISVYLVAAGQYHDIDFARLEILNCLERKAVFERK